jgi:hypothetical protein
MGLWRIPWLTLVYLVLGGGLVGAAYLLHFRTPVLELAVGATLPWSLGYGLFVWSAIHGLTHELAFYLAACLALNGGLLLWFERFRRRRKAASRADKTPLA